MIDHTNNTGLCMPCISNVTVVPQAPPIDCKGTGKCEEVYPAECVLVGINTPCYDIKEEDNLQDALLKIDAKCPYTVPNLVNILTIIKNEPVLTQLFCQIVCACDCGSEPPPPACTPITDLAVSMMLQSVSPSLTSATMNWITSTSIIKSGQLVKYRELGASQWTSGPVVTPGAQTAIIPGLNWYTTYEFTVDTICGEELSETVAPGPVVTGVFTGCPATIGVQVAPTQLTVSFMDVGGPVTHYTIKLNPGTIGQASPSWTSPNPVSGNVTHTFNGLSAGVNAPVSYEVEIIMHTANGPIQCKYPGYVVPPVEVPSECIGIDASQVTVTYTLP